MKVIVIGAGAAGLVAGAEAARRGCDVVLLEKNSKTGVKILMSGGTRCNVTQDTDARGIIAAFGKAGRFLQPSVGAFPPRSVVQMFHELDVPTKTEPTGKIFPQSDRALDVRDALHQDALRAGVDLRLRTGVVGLRREGDRWWVDTEQQSISADRVIVTSGGKSWPGCGTTGDAYDWLQRLGHSIQRTRPALVPLVGGHDWTRELSGVTLDDCVMSVLPATGKRKPLVTRRSSLLLTHFGFSGPAAMDVSGVMTAADSFDSVRLLVDLVPERSDEQIQSAITDRTDGKLRVVSVLSQWLPKRIVDQITTRTGSNVRVAELSRNAAHRLVQDLKRLELPVHGTRGFEKAEVTAGGVTLGEVDPRTMASRIAPGLFIAGEVLDVDGWIGGYNFQAAFSTGRAAAIAASTAEASGDAPE